MNSDDLSNDVTASMNRLTGALELPDSNDGPMGMNPAQMAGMFTMKLGQYARENPEKMVDALAVIHVATGDLIDKHAERNPSQIATEVFE